MKGYNAPSIKRAFAILNAISASRGGLGVSEIARMLNIAKSTTHGMTQALEEVGALIRDPGTKRYKLGFTLLEIGRRAYSQIDLQALTRPVMEDLMEKTRTSVFIGTLNLDRIIVLNIIEARQDLKITAPVGTTMSLFAGAVGKVFLASMESGEAERFITDRGLPGFTDNTIVGKAPYLKELEKVRKQGYALDDEEYILGVRAAAAPISNLGHLKAAIWVVGFKAGLDDAHLETVAWETRKAAEQISKRIQKKLFK
jgi:DNA-binding IclR family transcriptional regulator